MTPALEELLAKARTWYDALSPEDKAKHNEAQRQSFIRAFTTPCEHGELDFETCPKCGVYGSERQP